MLKLGACLVPRPMLPRHPVARHNLWRSKSAPQQLLQNCVDCAVVDWGCGVLAWRTVMWRCVVGNQTAPWFLMTKPYFAKTQPAQVAFTCRV